MRTDLHFHLLPGVDDGPRDDREAIELAQLAVADGTGELVATPHVRRLDVEELPLRTDELCACLDEAGVDLAVRSGGELSPGDVSALSGEQLEALAEGPPAGRWLLLEAPLQPLEADLAEAADELRERGFGVVIAHPERCPELTAAEIRRQVELGACLQLNASSLTGQHGADAERAALELVRSELPVVLASDAHSPSRPPLLTQAAQTLAAAGIGAARIRTAVDTGPAALLARGLPVPAAR